MAADDECLVEIRQARGESATSSAATDDDHSHLPLQQSGVNSMQTHRVRTPCRIL